MASVLIHGATAAPISAWYGRKVGKETLAEERESTAAGLFGHDDTGVPLITPDEVHSLMSGPQPPIILDVRSRSSYERDGSRIPGSVRVPPDQVAAWVTGRQPDRLVVAYCA